LIGAAFIVPQKVIGERHYGVYATAQALLTGLYMLTDSLALQPMVNFGMVPERRREAFTVAAFVHLLFIIPSAVIVYGFRNQIAIFFNDDLFVPTLALFPLTAAGFLLRNYLLKVAQLHIDTRATFLMDLAWIGTTVALILDGWRRGTLATASDMMMISAVASGASSVVGLLLYGRIVRFTTAIDREHARRMIRFGLAQSGSAATLALQTQGDVLILKTFMTSQVVANYDAAKKFARAFEALRDAGSLFVWPAVARLSVEHRTDELVRLVEKMIAFMLIVVVPCVLLVWILPIELLFETIYKGKYQDAPALFRVLSLAALAIPFSMNMFVLGGMGEARRFFRVTLASAFVSVLAALLLVPLIGAMGTALSVVISYAALGALSTTVVSRQIPISLPRALGRWRDARAFLASMLHRRHRRDDAE